MGKRGETEVGGGGEAEVGGGGGRARARQSPNARQATVHLFVSP